MLKYTKICGTISMIFTIICITLIISTVSAIEYEEDVHMPQDQRMTQAEFNERLIFAGLFGLPGVLFNFAAEQNEKYFEYITGEDEQ